MTSNSGNPVASTSAGTATSAAGAGPSNRIYPQFFPTCEGQEEDQLTESAVKAGYNNPFRGYVTVSFLPRHMVI